MALHIVEQAGRTDVGRQRTANEDSLVVSPPLLKIRAWADDANGSSTRMSAPSERPKVAPSPTSNVVPGSWPMAATTCSRGDTPERRSRSTRSRRAGPGASTGSAAAAVPP